MIRFAFLSLLALSLNGCAVIAAVDVAATAVVKTAGVAVDAAVGTARVAGKVVNKAVDAATQ